MSWMLLVDKTLGTHFNAPRYDPQKGRNKMVRQIDLAAKQHSENITRAPNRSWKVGGTDEQPIIRFAPKLDGKPVLLDGDDHVFVPASRFQDFLKHLKTSVQAGELDKEIKVALNSETVASAVKARSTGSVGGGRAKLSNVRSSFGRSMGNGKSLEEAEATARASGFDEALIAQVKEEKRAAQ